jgi:hypothetical protein
MFQVKNLIIHISNDAKYFDIDSTNMNANDPLKVINFMVLTVYSQIFLPLIDFLIKNLQMLH